MNVNALGNPVPSARFMGGREYERMKPETSAPTPEDIQLVVEQGKALYPAVENGSGPFPGHPGGWSHDAMSTGEKGAALSLYLAMMTTTCLELIGARGPIIIEGPFARNALYLDMLQARTRRAVFLSNTATGTSLGAALLCAHDTKAGATLSEWRSGEDHEARLSDYATKWLRTITAKGIRFSGDRQTA